MFLCQTKNGTKTFVHYLSAAEAIVVKSGNNAFEYYFPYTDHLGSIVAVTNTSGNIIAEQNFDAWGRKRNATNWTYDNIPSVPSWLCRGFTGHEHLDAFGLVNMNARLYDPILGRMLSPDNYAHEGSQGLNRYSYAHNNPLIYVDPDGNNPIVVFANAVKAAAPSFFSTIQPLVGIGLSIGASYLKPNDGFIRNANGSYTKVNNEGGNQYDVLYEGVTPSINYKEYLYINPYYGGSEPFTRKKDSNEPGNWVTVLSTLPKQHMIYPVSDPITGGEALAVQKMLTGVAGLAVAHKVGIFTTSSKSTAPSFVYTAFKQDGSLFKFGVSDAAGNRLKQSLALAGPNSTHFQSREMMKWQAHIYEKYLRSLHYMETGIWELPGMIKPYPVDFLTGRIIRKP